MPDPILLNEISNDVTTFEHFIQHYWPLLLALISFVVSILVILKGKIPLLEKRMDDAFNKLKKLEDAKFVDRELIFDKDNQFKFQTLPMCDVVRKDCQMQQKQFQETFCRKLDTISLELKSIVNDADKKRDETRLEITSMNRQLIELMTQMKTILARDRKEEISETVRLIVNQVIKEMRSN